ncbi:MAG: hypothetical protein Kow0010_00550 [Dehalococcoidia bacterium]
MTSLVGDPNGWYLALGAVSVTTAAASGWYVAGRWSALGLALAALVAAAVSREPTLAVSIAATAAGIAAWKRWRGLDPSRTAGFTRQLAVVGGGYAFYEAGRVLLRADFEPALENARRVISFERNLGLWVEPSVQDALGFGVSGRLLAETYSFAFHPVPIVALLLLYVADRRGYVLLRNGLGASVVLALALIALFPVAPPRLVPELEIVDTIAHGGRERILANQYAAIPSLHVGWLALVGFVLWLQGGWMWRAVAPVPGALMAVAVVATGNHYWVDPVIGTACAVGPIAVFLGVERLRATRCPGLSAQRAGGPDR